MKTTGSKTPRVDAAQKNRTHMTGDDCFWWVQSDFARTLEGELNETRQLLAEKNDTANVFMRQVKKLQAELAESRNEFATLSKACGNWREFNAPAEPSNADISHSRD
jgi:septal ring factor EnvC (AmiA/AmiB activator)